MDISIHSEIKRADAGFALLREPVRLQVVYLPEVPAYPPVEESAYLPTVSVYLPPASETGLHQVLASEGPLPQDSLQASETHPVQSGSVRLHL